MTSANKANVVYIHETQSPVEKRHGLNLMISMLSQSKDADGKMLLHKSVHQLAEIFVIMDTTHLPDADQLMRIIEEYPHDDIPTETKRQFLIQLSDGVFYESPVKKSSSNSTSRLDRKLDDQETDVEQEQQSAQVRSEVEVQKPVSSELFRGMLDDCMYGMGASSSKEKDTAKKELLLEKFLKKVDKLHVGHITSMILTVLFPRENIENQARAITNIFRSIDPKVQSLIQVPLASNMTNQHLLSSIHASLALACLLRQFYGQGTPAIKTQEAAIKAYYSLYKQEIVDPLNFRKNVRTELAVYDSLCRYFSTPSDKQLTERDNCEMLIKVVAVHDYELARQLQRELHTKDSSFDMETLLGALEENQRLAESLKLEPESRAKSGKGGSASSADKKGGAQHSANPAMQQQPKCPICGNEHDVSKCPKEIDRLKKEALKRGDKLPGTDKSTRRDSRSEEAAADDSNDGCFMCFALGRPSWKGHPVSKCYSKDRFTKRMEDPEHRPIMIERLTTKPSSARGSKATDRSNAQQQQSRNTQNERAAQSNRQDSTASVPQMQQMPAPVFREYSNPFGQQYVMSPQPSGGPSEYVSPWQLHNSVQNSSQFFQPNQQTMQRTAHVSQTMTPGYASEAPQVQFVNHPPGSNPMVLQVSPQSQIFRQVDNRQMQNVSEQGMMSIGAQAGNSAQQSDRYSGSDSSSANTAVRVQQSRGAALLMQNMGTYLSSSPYSQNEGQQRGNQDTFVNHGAHFANAMTAISVNQIEQALTPVELAMESFEQMPTWILQRFSIADIDPSHVNTSSSLSVIKQGATDIVETRVLAGEELTHQVIKGVVGHVAGLGQCFIDTRNVLNGVDECSKVTRNKMINDLLSNREEIVGWETVQNLLTSEYSVDLSDPVIIREFVSDYVDGKFQSGLLELLYAAKRDKSHYIVVSTVNGETTCAVTAIFPCYENCSNELKIVKAGMIAAAQIETPMMLFSHGGLINPHVMGSQLTHFAPVQIKAETGPEDSLNQCLIVLEPSPECHKESSNLLNSIEINEETLEKILVEQSENRINELPMKMEQILLHRKQQFTLYALCMWKDEINVSIGRKLIAEEKIIHKRNQENIKFSWQEWKQNHLFSKSIGMFSKQIISKALVTMVRVWFDNWKQSRDTKKRVQMHIRMNNVRAVLTKIMFGKLFDAWKFCKQDVSRSEQFSQSDTLVENMFSNSMSLLKRAVRIWKTEVPDDLQIKNQCATTIQSAFLVWIQRRRTQLRPNKIGESIPNMLTLLAQQNATPKREIKLCDSNLVQGLQEGNLDFTKVSLSPSVNACVRKGLSYVKAGEMDQKRIVILLKDVMHGWNFVHRKYSIKRYQEISLQYFTIRGLQQQVACSPIRAFRNLWNSFFNQYLIKRYFHFWIKHYEVTHGLTRSEMNKLFKKHIAKRAYRKHFWSWTSVVIRKKQQLQAYEICETTYKMVLLDSKFALWTKKVDEKIPRVANFLKSGQQTMRTRFFHKWKTYPFEQKSLFQKIRFVLRKCLFSWLKFTWEKQKPTSAEQFRQSSRCADLQHALRELLRKFRLNRLPQSVWLFLRRRGRLHHKSTNNPEGSQHEDQGQSQIITSAQILTNETHHLNAAYPRLPVLLYGGIAISAGYISWVGTVVVTVIFLLWILPILFVCAQTGGMQILKMFPTTLTNNEHVRVAMPASTKIITSGEIKDNFVTRRSLFDTGTDAYLRQDDSMMHPLFPSSTVISTAGPEQLKASHSGLLHLIVKDDKGNLHRLMLENALVVPRLSHNLTSHKQFVENGHMVFFHESQAGIVLNKEPKFSSNDIVIPFAIGENGMYYLEEYLPEEKAVAMVAQRMQKLTSAELVHISLCHVCPSLMRHLFRVTHLPRLKGLNDFRCHCCVEAKLKHAPKPPRSIRVITTPGELVSCDIVGPFRITSIHGNKYGLVFIDHHTNTPFNYAMKSKDEYPKWLQQFLIDFRELFKGHKVCEIQVLRSDNANELNSAKVQQIQLENGIKRQFACPHQQSQNGAAEKCIGDLWMMTKTSLLFSNVPRYLWDEAWFNAAYVKRHLPTTANEGFKSPLHMIHGNKIDIKHILPFGSLLYIALEKPQIPDPKFDPRAQATVYLGHGFNEGRKCLKGYSFNFGKKGFYGQIMYSINVHSDPTYFPFRKKGEERVTSLSGATFMSGKDKGLLDQEIPLPPEVQEWVNSAEMHYDFQESEDQQEIELSSEESDKQMTKDTSTPIENQIVGYNEAQDQYAVKSAGEIMYVDSSELFQKVSDGEKVFVEGVQGSIPGFSISFQDQEDMFIKKDGNMFVEHITVDEFKQKLDDIYRTTESPTQFYSIHDNIKEIIMKDLIQEDEERTKSKDVWKNQSKYDKSYSFPEVLEHDQYSEEVHAYAAKTVPNVFGSDELTLAQAQKLSLEWPLWLEAIKIELTSLIVTNEVFEPIEWKDVPHEKHSKIFNLLILLKRKRDQFGEISKHKARLVMDGSRAQIGVDVFDTYAPVIDYSTVRLLISLAFGNNWELFHWDISVAFTNAKAEEETYVRFPKSFPEGLFSGYKGGTIARLKRNLYGSKSAPKLWYKCLYEVLIELGFKSVAGHPCLFIRVTNVAGKIVIVVMGIFVDDLLVTGNSVEEIAAVQEKMKSKFVLTDQGELEYYLGVEVSKIDQNTLLLHQTGYAKKILERFKMTECNEVKTPLPRDLNLSLMDSPDEVDPILQSEYRAIVGSLMYLYQWTRPDLGFAVTFLSRYLHRPGEKHFQAAKHVLRYLKGTVGLGIRYTRDVTRLLARDQHLNVLYALSDSDFAGCKDTSRSTSGYMILMNGGVVAYYSGRQSTVALCTAMAETIALAKLVVKVKHMRAILFDLQCRQEQTTQINSTCVWVDNTAAIAVATGNDFTHETVKHVTVKVRFLQECVQRGIIMITYIKTSKNIADIMTKQSVGPQFAQHRDYALGIIDAITTVIAAFARVWRRLRFRV